MKNKRKIKKIFFKKSSPDINRVLELAGQRVRPSNTSAIGIGLSIHLPTKISPGTHFSNATSTSPRTSQLLKLRILPLHKLFLLLNLCLKKRMRDKKQKRKRKGKKEKKGLGSCSMIPSSECSARSSHDISK